MAQRPSPPRGMRDLLPLELSQRRVLLDRIIRAFEKWGYEQIETPALEELGRLIGSEGGDNEKLIYKVMKRGIDWPPATENQAADLGLRYDLTVPLARYYATHSAELLSPFRAIQAGPVWRAERPQKGRYRQFVQCDIDIINEPSVAGEVELLNGGVESLLAAGLTGFEIHLNDRRFVNQLLRKAGVSSDQAGPVLVEIDKQDKVGIDAVIENLRPIVSAESFTALSDLLRRLSDDPKEGLDIVQPERDSTCADDIRTIQSLVTQVPVHFDALLIRGQGYYTGSIFEVRHPDYPGSLAGGGRYDTMIGKLSGGTATAPAAGFSIGFERLWEVLGDKLNDASTDRVVMLHEKSAAPKDVQSRAEVLRRQYTAVRTEVAAKNRSAQLTRLAAAGFTHWSDAGAQPRPITEASQ